MRCSFVKDEPIFDMHFLTRLAYKSFMQAMPTI